MWAGWLLIWAYPHRPEIFRLKEDIEEILRKIPAIGGKVIKSVERVKDAVKTLIVPGCFEELGLPTWDQWTVIITETTKTLIGQNI